MPRTPSTTNREREPEKCLLAVFVHQRLKERKLTHRELASITGLSVGTVAAISAGNAKNPRASILEPLAKGLKVSYDELICVLRGIPYKPINKDDIDPVRLFDNYLMTHPKMHKQVAEATRGMIRTLLKQYE